MKKNKGSKVKSCILLAVVSISLLLTGCGSSTSGYTADSAGTGGPMVESKSSAPYAATDNLYSANTTEEVAADTETDGGSSSAEIAEESSISSRKLIKTVSMDVETEEYDKLMTNVQQRIEGMGGYVSNLSSGENGYAENTRYATIVAKIPAEKVDQFVTAVSDISNVTSKNESVDDVTLQYVDLESHKKALLTEQESLLKLMENATSMEDIISIESRLSDVRYQIESMESQLRTFDNQISFSEVTIYITEVTRLTPMEEVGTWQQISEGFMDNVYGVGRFCRNFFIQLMIHLPIIFLLAVLGINIFLLVRFIDKKMKKHNEKVAKKKKETIPAKNEQTNNINENASGNVPNVAPSDYASYADQRKESK